METDLRKAALGRYLWLSNPVEIHSKDLSGCTTLRIKTALLSDLDKFIWMKLKYAFDGHFASS